MRAESGPAPVHSCPGDVTGHAPGVSEGAGPAPRGGGEALWALGTRWRPQVLAGQALTSELCSATSETHKCPEKQDSTPSAEEGKELQKPGSGPAGAAFEGRRGPGAAGLSPLPRFCAPQRGRRPDGASRSPWKRGPPEMATRGQAPGTRARDPRSGAGSRASSPPRHLLLATGGLLTQRLEQRLASLATSASGKQDCGQPRPRHRNAAAFLGVPAKAAQGAGEATSARSPCTAAKSRPRTPRLESCRREQQTQGSGSPETCSCSSVSKSGIWEIWSQAGVGLEVPFGPEGGAGEEGLAARREQWRGAGNGKPARSGAPGQALLGSRSSRLIPRSCQGDTSLKPPTQRLHRPFPGRQQLQRDVWKEAPVWEKGVPVPALPCAPPSPPLSALPGALPTIWDPKPSGSRSQRGCEIESRRPGDQRRQHRAAQHPASQGASAPAFRKASCCPTRGADGDERRGKVAVMPSQPLRGPQRLADGHGLPKWGIAAELAGAGYHAEGFREQALGGPKEALVDPTVQQ
uniref:Uncharacterized protein n=1 Tax=Rangifer tarandus platyrhynchus TaxID=3082113 RepID=A0ACB0EQY0_RANTA|nr:unnamed protein product [Rangifer tarandus platyrhynchus]